MFKRFLGLAFTAAALSSPAIALLAPLNQSVAEMQALVSNPQLTANVPSSEQIVDVVRTPQGYLVLTTNYLMMVDVVYQPQTMPGPQKFDLVFRKPVPTAMQPASPSTPTAQPANPSSKPSSMRN